jgi:hypothetical protein
MIVCQMINYIIFQIFRCYIVALWMGVLMKKKDVLVSIYLAKTTT